jgi:hypothetical protein
MEKSKMKKSASSKKIQRRITCYEKSFIEDRNEKLKSQFEKTRAELEQVSIENRSELNALKEEFKGESRGTKKLYLKKATDRIHILKAMNELRILGTHLELNPRFSEIKAQSKAQNNFNSESVSRSGSNRSSESSEIKNLIDSIKIIKEWSRSIGYSLQHIKPYKKDVIDGYIAQITAQLLILKQVTLSALDSADNIKRSIKTKKQLDKTYLDDLQYGVVNMITFLNKITKLLTDHSKSLESLEIFNKILEGIKKENGIMETMQEIIESKNKIIKMKSNSSNKTLKEKRSSPNPFIQSPYSDRAQEYSKGNKF